MTQRTDKSDQIVHEAEITRQHARYKIPAKIEIEGRLYNVFDWSVSGVGVENLPEDIFSKKFVTARMIFKFDDFETVVDNLKLEFVSKRPQGVFGARFTELTPQQIAILNQIISAYLAGDIITEDDIIHAVTRANFSKRRESKAKADKKKSIAVLLLLWGFVFILISFLIFVMYKRIYVIQTQNAYFDAQVSVIRAPSPSYIELADNIKKGKRIKVSDIVAYSHMIYGGIRVIKSPINGEIYKINVKNGEFRNTGEPIVSIVNKNSSVYIIANILHKDLKKVRIGDIAKVVIPNGESFYAKVVEIKFPYDITEKHAKPLQNIYNQARNYDEVILKPINYKIDVRYIGTSVYLTIDTLLNKYDWYKIEEKELIEDKTESVEKEHSNKQKVNVQNIKNDLIKKEFNTSENNNTLDNKEKKESKVITISNKYCIIAASSSKPFHDALSKRFLKDYKKAKIVKVKNIYEIKISYFDTYSDAKEALNNYVKKYYKDAFIFKCKVKENE